jgi:valyl-tRNA synthetase
VRVVGLGASGYVLVGAHVDLETERQRLRTELAGIEADITRLRAHLDDPEFRAKAPAEVVEREEERLRRQEERLRRLRDALEA